MSLDWLTLKYSTCFNWQKGHWSVCVCLCAGWWRRSSRNALAYSCRTRTCTCPPPSRTSSRCSSASWEERTRRRRWSLTMWVWAPALVANSSSFLVLFSKKYMIVMLLYCIQATKDVNNMTVKMPYQCFINGQFEDAESGKAYDTINPTDGSVSDLSHVLKPLSSSWMLCNHHPPHSPRWSVKCPMPRWGTWTVRWQLPKKPTITAPGAGWTQETEGVYFTGEWLHLEDGSRVTWSWDTEEKTRDKGTIMDAYHYSENTGITLPAELTALESMSLLFTFKLLPQVVVAPQLPDQQQRCIRLAPDLWPCPHQACRPDGGTPGGAGHHRVHRLGGRVHTGPQDPRRHVHPDLPLLRWLVWQDPGRLTLKLFYKSTVCIFYSSQWLQR